MKENQSTFQRVEKKYLLEEGQYRALRQELEDHMKPDRFAKSTICNLYFDTPDSRLIRASLEKPAYKEKLRLRSYGTPEAESPAFVELKKKCRGVVYKRRIDLPFAEAEAYLCGRNRPKSGRKEEGATEEEQIMREIDWFLDFYGSLEPAMYLAYDRFAFCGKEDVGLRVTFDTNILYRTEALELSAGVWGAALLQPEQRLMEIKILGAMPLWLSRTLSELNIYPSSFSKYGQAYQKTGGKICA